MQVDPAMENFLGRWFMARIRDEAAAKIAMSLHGSLSTLIQGEIPAKFKAALTGRISGLKAMIERIEGEANNPPAPAGSSRGQWLRNAGRLLARWDESNWSATALALSEEKNPLMLSAVSQSLEESIEQEPGTAREAVEHVRKLRALDERDFRSVPVPAGPHAPWNPAAYVFPSLSRTIFEGLRPEMEKLVENEPADSPRLAPAKLLVDLFRLIDGGWPVPIARLESPLRQLASLSPEGSGFVLAIEDANRRLCQVEGDPDFRSETSVETDPATLARQRLEELARALRSEPLIEAQAFGHRLKELSLLPGSETPRGLHQELIGCLAFLDEPEEPGSIASSGWRASSLKRLAGICQGLGGGEVLNEQLLGSPLGNWTEFVTVVGSDEHDVPGEPGRITKIERIGYRVIFSNGDRRTLVRARVRIAP